MNEILGRITQDPLLGKLIAAVAGVIIIIILRRLVQQVLLNRLQNKEARYGIRRGLALLGYILIIIYIASLYNEQLGSLTVAFGVAGAGIAFALQEVIVSIAGWVALSFGQFYRIGDRIQLGNIKGDVMDIGMLRTTLMELGEWIKGDQYTGRIVRITNSFVFREPVFNFSADFPFLWDEITIPIKYGSNYRLAKTIVENAVREIVGHYFDKANKTWNYMQKKYAIEEAAIEPVISLVANDNWVEITARYIVDYKKRRSTKDAIFLNLLESIEGSGGSVSIASATFHLVEAPTINVQLSGK